MIMIIIITVSMIQKRIDKCINKIPDSPSQYKNAKKCTLREYSSCLENTIKVTENITQKR